MQVVQVDHVGAQPGERFVERALERLRTAVDHPLAVHTRQAAFTREVNARPEGRQYFAEQRFAAPKAVERSRVEMRDTQVERAVQELPRDLRCRRQAVGVRDIHAPKAQREDVEAADATGTHAAIVLGSARVGYRTRGLVCDPSVAWSLSSNDSMSSARGCRTSRPRRRPRQARIRYAGHCVLLALLSQAAHASDSSGTEVTVKAPGEDATSAQSPWILIPTFSNNPKLGTSLGGMAGYLKKFDPESQVSIFALTAQYTSTDSAIAAAIARTSFNADHHRLAVYVLGGTIKNDYDDYLGTGMPLKTEDHIRAVLTRYLHRVKGDWFIGAQLVATNYQIVGQTALDDDILNVLGLSGFESGGVGLAVYHDSRDIQDAPTRGWMANVNNVAYRQSIAGSADFDVYRLDYRGFWSHGNRHVFALRQSNQWTVDAPPAAYAPVLLRGYTTGEYLGKNMSSLEVEERYRVAERWTATVFAGLACLYGAGLTCSQSENIYPSAGAGVRFLLKPDKGIVANLEYAQGKDGNNAVIFKLGYSW